NSYKFTNYYTSESDVYVQILMEMNKVLSTLTGSKYGYQRVKSIHVDMELANGNKYAYIERVFMNKKELRAGEDVEIGLVMRPYGSETTFTETKTLHVPENLEDGSLGILVVGGSLSSSIKLEPTSRQGNNTLVSVIDTADNSTSFEQYFRKAMDFDKNNELVIKLVPASGDVLVVEGNKLEDMPPYMNQLFAGVNNSVFTTEKLEYKTVFTSDDYIPMGAVIMSVPVKNHLGTNPRDLQGKPLSVRIFTPKDPDALFVKDSPALARLAGELDEALEAVKKEQEGESAKPEEKKEEDKKEEAKPEDKKEEPKPQDKKPASTVSRHPQTLEIKEGDLAKGEFTGCSLGKDNAILPTVERLSETEVPEQMVTCSLQTEEGLYVGTGLKAGVYSVKEGRKPALVCRIDGLWVTRLIRTEAGLFAASAPSGKIYRIEGSQAPEAADTGHKYISDIIALGNGSYMAGFADSNELAIYSASFEKTDSLTHDGVYTTDFAAAPGGGIIIGTKKQLLKYQDGRITTLLSDLGGSVNCVAAAPDGSVYAYVAGKGAIVKYTPLGVEKITEKLGDCFRAVCDETGNAYFAGRDSVTRVYPDGRYATDQFREAAQFSDIAVTGEGRALLSSVNPGCLYEIRLHPSRCYYTTSLIDLGAQVRLSGITASAGGIDWYSAEDEASRTPLQPGLQFSSGRFAAGFGEDMKGDFNRITLSYFMPNRPPTIKLKNLAYGQKLSAKYKVEWEISDPDGDYLLPALSGVRDGAETILYPKPGELPKADAKPETSREIDTAQLADGKWIIKAVVTDAPSNPDSPSGDEVRAEVLVCNTAPAVEAALSSENNVLTVRGKASCPTIGQIAGVQYSYDGSLWISCKPEGGEFGGKECSFSSPVVIPAGVTGEKIIKVRAIDDFGNSADVDLKVNINNNGEAK
ncbi:MAG: hypothetical protein IJT95_03845, partial [Abditibacteriota bacterium]|nr:hypothetical protein [Abditibacteriota bacterium]